MLQVAPDTTIAVLDADATTAAPEGIERVMLAENKLPVVLAVVLIVWAAVLLLLLRTERRLSRVERQLEAAERTAATD